jgi:hypothetical protein
MSLNARIGLLAIAAVATLPLWLWFAPFLLLAGRRSRREGRARGLHVLTANQARTIAAQAEASLPVAPSEGWAVVARNVDRYLAAVDSPRRWRTLALLTLLEWSPLLRLQAPLSRSPVPRRRAFLERHLATTHGLMALPSLARQLVRIGYYADAGISTAIGFRSMAKRQSTPHPALHAAAIARKVV